LVVLRKAVQVRILQLGQVVDLRAANADRHCDCGRRTFSQRQRQLR
jgi:hypothetical protein